MILRQNAPLRAPQLLSVAMVSVSFLLLGCGGSDPPPLGSLNPNSTTYPGVVSTSSGTGGTGGTGSSEPCVRTPPPSEFITDFSDWVGNDWGSAGKLAGGSFDYHGDATTEFEYRIDLREENMHVTGVINDYAGFGISLDPCTDATSYSGVQFDIWGTANSAVFQVQTSEDQNVEYNDPRAVCQVLADGDECVAPQSRIGAVPEAQETLQFAWGDFSGGKPVPTLSPDQILGFQFQFECASGGMCPVDVRIDNLQFY